MSDYSQKLRTSVISCQSSTPVSQQLLTIILSAADKIDELEAKSAKPIAEHPDVQRLIGQVVELQAENKDYEKVCNDKDAYMNQQSTIIAQLRVENERLKEILKEYRTCELCKHGQRLEFLMDEEWKKYCQDCESGSPENNWEFDEQALIKALKGQTNDD